MKSNNSKKIAGTVAGLLALLLGMWMMRTTPLVHDTIYEMSGLWPLLLVSFGPILVIGVVAFRDWNRHRKTGRAHYWMPKGIKIALGLGITYTVIALIVGGVLWGALQGQALYKQSQYDALSQLPAMGSVRSVPFEVMDNMANSGFSSTTEELENGHLVVENGKLQFTHEVAPSGFLRRRSQPTLGMAIQDPTSSERTLKVKRSSDRFETAPSTKGWFFKPWEWKRSLRIAAYKKNYLAKIAEYKAIQTQDGQMLFVAPYYKYKGFIGRRQVLSGVFVLHADGKLEDLSLDQARKRPELSQSGTIVPDSYARDIQEAARYKNGLWNAMFGRKEIYELDESSDGDSSANRQPYLTVLASGRPVWVATFTPKGKSNSSAAVMLTDAATGQTQLWKPGTDQFLTGAGRALAVVKERPIPGITWNGGNYVALEPRPLFLDGKLHFLISVAPQNMNALVKSVIVDAGRNKVVAVIDHDEPGGDQELQNLIRSGKTVTEVTQPSEDQASSDTDETPALPDSAPAVSGQDSEEIIRKLIEQNEQQREQLQTVLKQLEQSSKK